MEIKGDIGKNVVHIFYVTVGHGSLSKGSLNSLTLFKRNVKLVCLIANRSYSRKRVKASCSSYLSVFFMFSDRF